MRIAIAGCGQLARMLALAGWEMGHHFVFIADPGESTDCVRGLGDVVHLDDALSGANLYTALGQPDIVTVEKEHVSGNASAPSSGRRDTTIASRIVFSTSVTIRE